MIADFIMDKANRIKELVIQRREINNKISSISNISSLNLMKIFLHQAFAHEVIITFEQDDADEIRNFILKYFNDKLESIDNELTILLDTVK